MFGDNLSTTIRKWGGSSSQDEGELRFLVEAEKTMVIQTSSQKPTVQCEITVCYINVLISDELICTTGRKKEVGLCPRTIWNDTYIPATRILS